MGRIFTHKKNVLVGATQQAIIRDQLRHLLLMEPHFKVHVWKQPLFETNCTDGSAINFLEVAVADCHCH